jgi:hypothetical protein
MGVANRSDPAGGGQAVTKSDTTYFTGGAARAIYVGTGGDMTVVLLDRTTTLLFANIQDGSIIPIQCTRINSTGTDASDFVALR